MLLLTVFILIRWLLSVGWGTKSQAQNNSNWFIERDSELTALQWLSQSPDFNPTENQKAATLWCYCVITVQLVRSISSNFLNEYQKACPHWLYPIKWPEAVHQSSVIGWQSEFQWGNSCTSPPRPLGWWSEPVTSWRSTWPTTLGVQPWRTRRPPRTTTWRYAAASPSKVLTPSAWRTAASWRWLSSVKVPRWISYSFGPIPNRLSNILTMMLTLRPQREQMQR